MSEDFIAAICSIVPNPLGLHLRWPRQGLHNHTILFRLCLQSLHLFRGCVWRGNIKMKTNALETDGHVFRYPKRASKIQVSFHRDLNAFRRYTHSSGHHLTGDLRASRQSSEQKVTGTSACTGASDTLVGFGLVDGTPEIH